MLRIKGGELVRGYEEGILGEEFVELRQGKRLGNGNSMG